MAEVVKLERTVSVRFPEMRARLRQAVDALCDRDFQERVWVHGKRTSPAELSFDDALLLVVDEMEMFSTTELVGDVLIDTSELRAFEDLVSAISELITAIGKSGSFADALASGSLWKECVKKAREMQLQLALAERGSA
jgi:hypothetical protein